MSHVNDVKEAVIDQVIGTIQYNLKSSVGIILSTDEGYREFYSSREVIDELFKLHQWFPELTHSDTLRNTPYEERLSASIIDKYIKDTIGVVCSDELMDRLATMSYRHYFTVFKATKKSPTSPNGLMEALDKLSNNS